MATHKLTVLGCGDAFESGGRRHTAFHVNTPHANFLIDCGTGVLAGLHHAGIGAADIDLIFISHFHGDHYGGLPYFLLDSLIRQRKKPLTIVSPPGAKEKIGVLLDLLYPGSPVLRKLDIDFVSYQSGKEMQLGQIGLEAYPVIHTPQTRPHGLRIKTGERIIAYSGDTEWTDKLLPLSHHADLFICECNFYGLSIKNHMNYSILKEKRALLTCKKLLLTHFDTEMLNHLDEIKELCAYDGMQLEI